MSSRERIRQPSRKSARLKAIQQRKNQHQDQVAPLQPAVPTQPAPARPRSENQYPDQATLLQPVRPLSEANLRSHNKAFEMAGKRKRKQPTNTEEATLSDINTSAGSSQTGVKNPLYRSLNLTANHISMRPFSEKLPIHIANLINDIARDRDSLGPSLDQIRQDSGLHELRRGSSESAVENYFKAKLFAYLEPSDSLKRIDKIPIAQCAVPDSGSGFKVSTPVPDMVYGYNRGAFLQHQTQLLSIGAEMVANSQDLIYPFFVIELKADGPSGPGSLWVATNQCLGGSASCINIAESLNRRLKQCNNDDEIRQINSAAFSIAMSGTEARLYISWKHDELDYYTQDIDSFLLQKPTDYIEFRKHVLNIIDWGKNERLEEIQDSLDILEENRKTAPSNSSNADQLSKA